MPEHYNGETLLREFAQIEQQRYSWEPHWEEVSRRVMPSFVNTFYSPDNKAHTFGGEKNSEAIFDSTAAIAAGRFSAVMESMLTPRSQFWSHLTVFDESLFGVRRVREYLDTVNKRLFKFRYAPEANFASQNHMVYTSLGILGTAGLFIDKSHNMPGLRYRNIHLAELYFEENHQGQINSAWRRFYLTPRQAVMQFGKDKVSTEILDAFEGKKGATSYNEKFWFLHCVKPRLDFDPNRLDAQGMPWASFYVSFKDKNIIEESGYATFPYSISRYTQGPGEIYGRSPAMNVLPAINTLNEEKRSVIKQGQRTVDPVLLLHDDAMLDSFSLRSDALNYGAVSAEGRPLVQTLPTGNIAVGIEMMSMEMKAINDEFLVSLFEILVETPTMTATEVIERVREKGILLSPTMGRQQSEYLGPMIERELDLLARQQLLPEMPNELREAGGNVDIVYDSPLSRAQRAEEAAGLMRTVEAVMNISTTMQNPAPMDHFNWDIIVPEIAEIQAVPPKWLNDAQAIGDIRQGRAQAQAQQQQIQAAPSAAAMVKAQAVAQKAQEGG